MRSSPKRTKLTPLYPNEDKQHVLKLNPEIRDIDDFTFEDITIEGYQSHSAIKFPEAAV